VINDAFNAAADVDTWIAQIAAAGTAMSINVARKLPNGEWGEPEERPKSVPVAGSYPVGLTDSHSLWSRFTAFHRTNLFPTGKIFLFGRRMPTGPHKRGIPEMMHRGWKAP
jgi:hypothetical protein